MSFILKCDATHVNPFQTQRGAGAGECINILGVDSLGEGDMTVLLGANSQARTAISMCTCGCGAAHRILSESHITITTHTHMHTHIHLRIHTQTQIHPANAAVLEDARTRGGEEECKTCTRPRSGGNGSGGKGSDEDCAFTCKPAVLDCQVLAAKEGKCATCASGWTKKERQEKKEEWTMEDPIPHALDTVEDAVRR